MAALATYDFNGTAAGNIVSDFPSIWNNITGESGICDQNDAVAGRGSFSAVRADTGIRNVSTTFPDDQYAQAKVWVVSTSGGTGPGVVVRSASAADTYYRTVVNHAGGTPSGTNNITLSKIVAGGSTTIWTRSVSFTDGDTIRLEAQGTTLRVFINGSQVGADATDSAISTGNPGICMSTNVTSASIDDFEAGSLSANAFSLAIGAGSYAVTGTAA